MSNDSVRVADKLGGVRIATRTTAGPDETTSEERSSQLFDLAPSAVDVSAITAVRTGIVTSDSLLMDPLPAGVEASIIDVRDASGVLVYGTVTIGSTNAGLVKIIPIAIGNDGGGNAAYGVLNPVVLRAVDFTPGGGSSTVSTVVRLSATEQLTSMAMIPTLGVGYIGFAVHVEDIVSFDLYASKGSMYGRNSEEDYEAAERFGDRTFPGNGGG